MEEKNRSKSFDHKIISDPVYGFISVSNPFIFRIIGHPYFQRLRRISQLGLSSLVFPGAVHNRYQHSLGAMHLMDKALGVLENKGVGISRQEATASKIAILLHDAGHSPLSHTLEHYFMEGISHEDISLEVIRLLKEETEEGEEIFDTAMRIYSGDYPKKFLHQLISNQLDMDRMDYLRRDSFYTGVSEGIINFERLIEMLNVSDDRLVVEEKGLYSVENFIIARKLMYWVVYLHKNIISLDAVVGNIVRRVRDLILEGEEVECSGLLREFLLHPLTSGTMGPERLKRYMELDDMDLWYLFKQWTRHRDPVLSFLSTSLIERRLFHAALLDAPLGEEEKEKTVRRIVEKFGLKQKDQARYFFTFRPIENHVYKPAEDKILIMNKNGQVKNISEVSHQFADSTRLNIETKYFVTYPKGLW